MTCIRVSKVLPMLLLLHCLTFSLAFVAMTTMVSLAQEPTSQDNPKATATDPKQEGATNWGRKGSGGLTPANVTCGPPTYSCSTHSTNNPGNIAPIFTSSLNNNSVTTCVGDCVNATKYDTILNPSGTDCITRITDGTTFPNGVSAAGTFSGGDNDIMGSVNETYLGVTSTGGATYILHMNTSGNCTQVVNTGHPGISIGGPFGFSKVTDTRFYFLKNHTQLYQGDICTTAPCGDTTTFNQQLLVDIFAPNICPGVTPFTAQSGSILGIKFDDSRFGWSVGPQGQGSADWSFVWDKTLGCASVDFATGQYWIFCKTNCTPTTPAAGTLNAATGCFGSQGANGQGIHNSQMSGDGNFLIVSLNVAGSDGSWKMGACANSTIASQVSMWHIGTSGDQWGYDASSMGCCGAELDNHPSVGIDHVLSNYFTAWNTRSLSDVTHFTAFNTWRLTDSHLSWPHPLNDDSYPWVGASDQSRHGDGTIGVNGCTSSVYCPKYLINQVSGWFPNATAQLPKLFAHTFSCNQTTVQNLYDTCVDTEGGDAYFGAQNAIGVATQKGNFFCWVSTHLHNLGNDDQGHHRADEFCVRLQ
jgi:hypothetical protein